MDSLGLNQEVTFEKEDLICMDGDITCGIDTVLSTSNFSGNPGKSLKVCPDPKTCSQTGQRTETQELVANDTGSGNIGRDDDLSVLTESFLNFIEDLSPIFAADFDRIGPDYNRIFTGANSFPDVSTKNFFGESAELTAFSDEYAKAVSSLKDFDSEDARKDTAGTDEPESKEKYKDTLDFVAKANSLPGDFISHSDTSFKISSGSTDHDRAVIVSEPMSHNGLDADANAREALDQAVQSLAVLQDSSISDPTRATRRAPKASRASKQERSKNPQPTSQIKLYQVCQNLTDIQ